VRRSTGSFRSTAGTSFWPRAITAISGVDALFPRPARPRPHLEGPAGRLACYRPDAVCGPLTGLAFVAYAIAEILGWSSCLPRPC
jgi:hypothetical protein